MPTEFAFAEKTLFRWIFIASFGSASDDNADSLSTSSVCTSIDRLKIVKFSVNITTLCQRY